MTCVVDDQGALSGIITDGDLRRHMTGTHEPARSQTAGDVMTRNPVTIRRDTLAAEALLVLERRKITSIVVVSDDQRVQGVVHLHHLWRTEIVLTRCRIAIAGTPRELAMSDYALLAVLLALLLGLVAGKAWERYKLRDGRWIDRRRLRETPHYMLGLNCLVDNQVDQAVEELTRATSTETDALEIQMILGNLYRQKGQVGRAITVHQGLLQRPDLRPIEHAHVLLCLGLDYKHGGFIDRALETFQEVVRLDPKNRYAFVNLQKLYEDQQQWAEAAAVREKIAAIDDDKQEANQPDPRASFATKSARRQMRAGDDAAAAAKTFEAAIDIDARTAPAYLNLGDARERMGQAAAAVEAWEKLVQTLPDRAYLALDRLERAYQRAGTPHRFAELCERLIDQNPQDWRTRLALSRHLAAAAGTAKRSSSCSAALPHNPHGLTIHQEVVEGAARAQPGSGAGPGIHGADPQRGLLPGSARLHALPVPEHRVALAVPAVPRVEHVRGGADVTGQGYGRGGARRVASSGAGLR